MARRLREKSHLAADGWSKWYKAMVPDNGQERTINYEKRSPGHTGLICRNIREQKVIPPSHGIYEWRAIRGVGEGGVVYIGNGGEGRGLLRSRIREYCIDGSHKSGLVDAALADGYTLQVRFKRADSQAAAENEENELLETYDYAWNIRKNGRMRFILPPNTNCL